MYYKLDTRVSFCERFLRNHLLGLSRDANCLISFISNRMLISRALDWARFDHFAGLFYTNSYFDVTSRFIVSHALYTDHR